MPVYQIGSMVRIFNARDPMRPEWAAVIQGCDGSGYTVTRFPSVKPGSLGVAVDVIPHIVRVDDGTPIRAGETFLIKELVSASDAAKCIDALTNEWAKEKAAREFLEERVAAVVSLLSNPKVTSPKMAHALATAFQTGKIQPVPDTSPDDEEASADDGKRRRRATYAGA